MARMKVMTFPDIEGAREKYLEDVDDQAEALRRKLVTASPGQAMTYEEKYLEAIGDGPKPFLEKEAAALGVSVEEVAEAVRNARAKWRTNGSDIEARRIRAKAMLKQAKTPADMHAITKDAFLGL